MMRVTKNHVDMLYRIALAECFTSPTVAPEYDRHKVIADLTTAQYVRFNSGLRLTDDGRDLLIERLDRERAGVLRRVRARRSVQ